MSATAAATHSVSIWGSHPDAGNDDCWTGEDFATMAGAQAAVDALLAGGVPDGWHQMYANDFAFVELDSPELAEPRVYANKKDCAKRRREDDQLARSEAQQQAAMGYGIQGWNDYEGC